MVEIVTSPSMRNMTLPPGVNVGPAPRSFGSEELVWRYLWQTQHVSIYTLRYIAKMDHFHTISSLYYVHNAQDRLLAAM